MSQWKRTLRQRFAGSDCKTSPCLRREGLPATSLVHTWKHICMETCTRGNTCTWKHAHVEARVHMYGIRVHTVPVLAPIFEQWKPSYGKGQKSAGNLQSAQLSISCIYIIYIYMYVCMYVVYHSQVYHVCVDLLVEVYKVIRVITNWGVCF